LNFSDCVATRLPFLLLGEVEIFRQPEEFHKAKQIYDKALKSSGYDHKLQFEKKTPTKRIRKIIWFNPSNSMNVKTNIGKSFLKLIDKHFPKAHKYHKLLYSMEIQ